MCCQVNANKKTAKIRRREKGEGIEVDNGILGDNQKFYWRYASERKDSEKLSFLLQLVSVTFLYFLVSYYNRSSSEIWQPCLEDLIIVLDKKVPPAWLTHPSTETLKDAHVHRCLDAFQWTYVVSFFLEIPNVLELRRRAESWRKAFWVKLLTKMVEKILRRVCKEFIIFPPLFRYVDGFIAIMLRWSSQSAIILPIDFRSFWGSPEIQNNYEI